MLFLAGSCVAAAGRAAPDRLERFRDLARTRLSLAELVDPENPAEAYREIYALLDEEIVESCVGRRLRVPGSSDRRGFRRRGGAHSPPARRRCRRRPFKLTDGAFPQQHPRLWALRDESALRPRCTEGRPALHAWRPADCRSLGAAWVDVSGRDARPDRPRATPGGVAPARGHRLAFPRAYAARTPCARPTFACGTSCATPVDAGGRQTEQEECTRRDRGRVTRVPASRHNACTATARHRGGLRALAAGADAPSPPSFRTATSARGCGPQRRARRTPLTGPASRCRSPPAGPRGPWSLTFRRAGPRWA